MRTLEERLIEDVKAERYYRAHIDSYNIVSSALSECGCDTVCVYQDEDSCIGYEDALIACASPEEVKELAYSACYDIDAHSFEIHPIDIEGKTLYACSWIENITSNRQDSWLESMHVLGVTQGEISRVGLSIWDMKQDLIGEYKSRGVFFKKQCPAYLTWDTWEEKEEEEESDRVFENNFLKFAASGEFEKQFEGLLNAVKNSIIIDIDYLNEEFVDEIDGDVLEELIKENRIDSDYWDEVLPSAVLAVKIQKEDGQEWLYTLDEGDAIKEVFKAIEKRPVTEEVVKALEDFKSYLV